MDLEATSDRIEASRGSKAAFPIPSGNAHRPLTHGSLATAAGLVLVVVLILLVPRLDEIGVTWDEPWYFNSALRIQDWAVQVIAGPERRAALGQIEIEEAWGWAPYYNPHPPAYKIAMASTEAATGRWVGSVAGFRLASALWFALLVSGVGWLAARQWGAWGGGAAVLALLLMPRVLGHAHVAATDMPLSFFSFCGCVGLALVLRRGGAVPTLLAILGLGLAMATKFTGYLAPVPVILWAMTDSSARRRLPWTFLPLVGALTLAVLVNPLAWHDPWAYVGELFRESLDREAVAPIATYYLGEQYPFSAPWHYPIVMTLVTVPLGVLLTAVWGSLASIRRRRECWLAQLCLVQVLFYWLLVGFPGSPSHDGVRLFLPAFPFLALLAGRGFVGLLSLLGRRVEAAKRPLATVVLSLVLFLPASMQTWEARPYYLAYYGEVIGGARGAEVRGLEASYWYDAVTPRFLAELNAFLPAQATVATFPTQDYFRYLQGLGPLRSDIEIRGHLPADYLLLYGRKAVFDSLAWNLYITRQPVRAVTYQGVELLGLYSMSEEILEGESTTHAGVER